MAGLGTGAAPFRAFLQHLAMLAQKGQEVGPVYYYFGSRYQAAEYLYGEEIEAFILDGIITKAGLAFSRDGNKKVYIQHKMLEDSEALAKMLYDDEGVFYLCGPTWPVPDVYEALVNALVKYKGLDAKTAGDFLESLKEEERYVLEVCHQWNARCLSSAVLMKTARYISGIVRTPCELSTMSMERRYIVWICGEISIDAQSESVVKPNAKRVISTAQVINENVSLRN